MIRSARIADSVLFIYSSPYFLRISQKNEQTERFALKEKDITVNAVALPFCPFA
jgi:hypothetical protein